MIIFAKICKSKHYKDFILLFVHPTKMNKRHYLYKLIKK